MSLSLLLRGTGIFNSLFPTNEHDIIQIVYANAAPGDEAAHCVGVKGCFWDYHDKLIAAQYSLGQETFISYAEELEMGINPFIECYTNCDYRYEMGKDLRAAATLDIKGTPLFFINGYRLIGVSTFEIFQQILNQNL